MTSPLRISLGGAPDVEPVSVADLRIGFKAAFVLELVEDDNPNALDTHVFPLNPQGYTLSEPFTSTLTPGEDDGVVVEENGTIISEISLSGTPGFAVKTSASFLGVGGKEIGGVKQSGNLHFHALRKFFRRYSKIKKDPTLGPRVKMHFHCLKDDDHFIVVPRSFETPRDARSTRVHYEYRISLAAVGLSDRSFKDPVDPFGMDDVFRVINEAFNDARSFFAELTADLSAIKRKVGNIQSVMINVGGFLNAVGNFVRGAGEVIQFGIQQVVTIIDQLDSSLDQLTSSLFDATFGTLGNAVRSGRKLTQALQRIAVFGDRFENAADDRLSRLRGIFSGEKALTRFDIENAEAGASFASSTRIARGSEGRGAPLATPTGVREETIYRGDSVASIAARFGVPAEVIVVLNDLCFPYIAPGGGPCMLKPGDTILIPLFGTSTDDSGLAPSAEYLTADEALYGRDIALDPRVLAREQRLEIKPDLAHGGYDAETVTGIANVVQGVRILIETERGETVYIPDLGIRRTAGIKGTLRHLVLTALNLRTAILQDPRIDDIQESSVVLDGDVVQQEITPTLKGQRDRVTFVLPIGIAGA